MDIKDFLSFVPDQHVFHYTDAKGFRGIITDRAIRATNILGLSDGDELRYGIHLAQCQMKNEEESTPKEDIGFLNLMNGLLNAIHQQWEYNIYIASFCEDGGDRESQWREYGDNGKGISIGFDFSDEHRRQELQRLQPGNRFRFQFVKCEYNPTKQVEIIHEFIREGLDTFHQTQRVGRVESADMLSASHFLLRFLYQVAPRLKKPALEKEQERRLVLSVQSDDKGVQFAERRESFIRYIDFKLADELLWLPEIVMGPCAQAELSSENSVRDFLLSNHVECPSIRHSAIPCDSF